MKNKKTEKLLTAALIVCLIACVITVSAQSKKPEDLKTEWNKTICIILRVLQFIAGAIVALTIITAGIKYLTSDDPGDREGSKNMIIQAFAGLIILFIAVQVVNYLVTGSKVERFDMNSCDVLSVTTTTVGSSTTSSTTPITGPTTTAVPPTTGGPTTTGITTTTQCNLSTHDKTACGLADFWGTCDKITVTTPQMCCECFHLCCP